MHLRSTSGHTAAPGTKLLALVAVAAVVAIWGLSGIAIKLTSTTGLVASFYRLWFAMPLLWSVAAGVPSIRRRLDREWLGACLVGGVLFGLHQILFFTSIKLTSVANVTIIGALQPALVLLFAGRMFRERVTLSAVAWSFLALGGTVLVVIGSAGTPAWTRWATRWRWQTALAHRLLPQLEAGAIVRRIGVRHRDDDGGRCRRPRDAEIARALRADRRTGRSSSSWGCLREPGAPAHELGAPACIGLRDVRHAACDTRDRVAGCGSPPG